MSEPKFGEWQHGPVPKGTPVLMYYKNSAYYGGMAVLYNDSDSIGHWMPLPTPPEEWEEAWKKYEADRIHVANWEIPAFKAGFEAGRKECNRK